MAPVQRFTAPDGTVIDLNWATDQIMEEVLNEMKKLNGGSGGVGGLGDAADDAGEKLSKTAKASGSLNKSLKKLGDGADRAFDGLSKVESSASSLTKELVVAVGATGALGSILGFAASTFDSFIDTQVSAIQAGFSFSNQLIETRDRLASIGLNFDQLNGIIASEGEAIRSLGGTGAEAADNFTDLVFSVRDATKEMGFFGLSSEEMAGELADLVGRMVRTGATQDEIMENAASSMAALNMETLGLARLTGQQRRELMRNNAILGGDSLFQSIIGELGPDAAASADALSSMMTATFGDAAPQMIDLVRGLIIQMESGIVQLSSEQLAFLERSGMSGFFNDMARDFVSNAGDIDNLTAHTRDFMSQLSRYMQENEEETRQALILFQRSGNLMAEFYQSLLDATVQNRVLAQNVEKQGTMPFTAGLEETTKQLLSFKQQLDVFINEVRSGILQIFGVDDFSALQNLNIAGLIENLNSVVGDIVQFRDWVGDFFSEGGSAATSFLVGLAGMFLLPKVAIGAVGAIGGLFSGLLGSKILIKSVTTAVSGLWAARGVVANALKSGASALWKTGGPIAKSLLTGISTMIRSAGKQLIGTVASKGFLSALLRLGPAGGAVGLSAFLGEAVKQQDNALNDLYSMHPDAQGLNYGQGVPPADASYHLEQLTRDPDWMNKVIAGAKTDGSFRNFSTTDFVSQLNNPELGTGIGASPRNPVSPDFVPTAPSVVESGPISAGSGSMSELEAYLLETNKQQHQEIKETNRLLRRLLDDQVTK